MTSVSLNKVEFFEQKISIGCIETGKSGFLRVCHLITKVQTFYFKFLNVGNQLFILSDDFLSKKH